MALTVMILAISEGTRMEKVRASSVADGGGLLVGNARVGSLPEDPGRRGVRSWR